MPLLYCLSKGLVCARSVPCFRNTLNCSGVSNLRHSSSVLVISKVSFVVAIAVSVVWIVLGVLVVEK